ncbi:glyoxalase/bleomycin resistance/dioxygenase family protein, partial [Streptomyces albidoflavus]
MCRAELALTVPDLDASGAFDSRRFGAEPAKLRPGYANFALTEPPFQHVLIQGEPGGET